MRCSTLSSIIIACAALMLFSQVSAASAQTSKALRVLVNDSPLSAACEQVVEEALTLINYRLVRVIVPPNRAIKEASEGFADGTICRIPEFYRTYPNMIRIDPSIVPLRAHVFSKNLPLQISQGSWGVLQPYFTATINGHLYSTKATRFFPRIHRVKNSEKALQLLVHNRLDTAVLVSINVVRNLTFRPEYQDITMSTEPIADIPLHFYLHKKNKRLVTKLSKAFQEIVASGRAAQIYREIYAAQLRPI